VELTEVNHYKCHVHTEVEVILIAVSNGKGIHAREFPNVANWISHLEQRLYIIFRFDLFDKNLQLLRI
jgi:hypothetical protein